MEETKVVTTVTDEEMAVLSAGLVDFPVLEVVSRVMLEEATADDVPVPLEVSVN